MSCTRSFYNMSITYCESFELSRLLRSSRYNITIKYSESIEHRKKKRKRKKEN